MKNLFRLLVAGLFLFTSCDKEVDSTTPAPNTNSSILDPIGFWQYDDGWNRVTYMICSSGMFQRTIEDVSGGYFADSLVGTWTVDGGTINFEGTTPYTLSFSDNVTIVTNGGVTHMVFDGPWPEDLELMPSLNPCDFAGMGTSGVGTGGGGGGGTPNCGTSAFDADGNQYNVIQIGNQCWLDKNLRTTKYLDGSPIQLGTANANYNGQTDWTHDPTVATIGHYMPNLGNLNGYLYNISAITDTRKICPNGFRVPTEQDYEDLINYLGGASAADAALQATSGWVSMDWNGNTIYGNGTNSSGFTAYPTGSIGNTAFGWGNGNLDNTYHSAVLATSTVYAFDVAVYYTINNFTYDPFDLGATVSSGEWALGAGCRCIAE